MDEMSGSILPVRPQGQTSDTLLAVRRLAGRLEDGNHGVVWFPISEKMGLRFRSRETFRKKCLDITQRQW